MIASCIAIFSCNVTHKQLIFILCHFQSVVLIFQCKSEANTVWCGGETHLTAQTPVWQGVIDSTTPEHNHVVSQEAERVHTTQSE